MNTLAQIRKNRKNRGKYLVISTREVIRGSLKESIDVLNYGAKQPSHDPTT
jgi:hypothetical protein